MLSVVISIKISLVFCISPPNQLNAWEKKHQKALLSHNLLLIAPAVNSAAQTQNHPLLRRLYATPIFPGIAGRQTGKKNDQHALLTPRRSESYTLGCGYYLSSSKSACLVIIRAWDRNLSSSKGWGGVGLGWRGDYLKKRWRHPSFAYPSISCLSV